MAEQTAHPPHLEGSFVALITPMNRDCGIDYAGFRTLIDWHASHGTRALLIMGSTGEVSLLSQEERRRIVEETVKHKPHNLELWYGCTGNNTETTIDYVKHAAAAGADGAIVAAPAYICASNASIVQFCLEVADASPTPLGFYNNPPRVNTDLTAPDILRIAGHPNMKVLKESTTRVGQIAQLCAARPDMALMCCCSPNLGLVVPLMALGGHGTANMSGNLIPREMATISAPWASGADAFACRDAWLKNLPMLHFTYSAINPVATKSLMAALGMPAGPLRKPLTPIAPDHLRRGLDIVRDLGIADTYGYNLKPRLVAAE